MILEEFGVEPIKIIDFKGLAGDSSDNIPGIPGFGPKTATKLLVQFGSVEGVIEHVEEVSNKRWRGLIKDNDQQALLSKKLATIMLNVPLDIDDEELLVEQPDLEEVVTLLKKYEFTRLISRYKTQDMNVEKEEVKQEVIEAIIIDSGDVSNLIKEIKDEKEFVFHFVLDKENIVTDEVIGIGVCVKDNYYYIVSNDSVMEQFKEVFEDKNIIKYGHELKQEYLKLFRYNIKPYGFVFDTFIAAYLINPEIKSYDLSELLVKETGKTILSKEEFLGKGKKAKQFIEMPVNELAEFTVNHCFGIKEIRNVYIETLKDEELEKLYYDVELPLVEVLAELEFEGILVDQNILDELDINLTKKVEDLSKSIYEHAGEEFNINSPKQLGVILFESLKLPIIKKTKTGYSTSHDILMIRT